MSSPAKPFPISVSPPPRVSRRWFIRLGLAALVALVYARTVTFEFVTLDDHNSVRDNDMVRRGVTTEGIVWAFTTAHDSNWLPITWLSLMADVQVQRWFSPVTGMIFHQDEDGLFPGAFHLTNVVLHALNVLLLFSLLRKMTGAEYPSAFVAALLAVHPMHVESVAWVTERKDVLSLFFMLLTVRAYVMYVRMPDWQGYAALAAWFALGLMSKSMLVTLPAVLLLLDFWPLNRWPSAVGWSQGWRTAVRLVGEKLPLLLLSLACGAITMWIQVVTLKAADGVPLSLSVRLGNAAISYLRYLGKFLWPVDLAALYPNPAQIGKPWWSAGQIAAAAVIVAMLSAAFVWLGLRRRYVLVGWLWFLGTLTPVIGFIQIGRHAMADRYTYIPYLGLYVMVAWGAADLTQRWRARRAPLLAITAAVALSVLTIVAFRQVGYWRNARTLDEHTLAVTHDNWLVHCSLGLLELSEAEKQTRANRPAEAEAFMAEGIKHLQRAVEISPNVAWLRDHLARAYDRINQYEKAEAQWRAAVRLEPNTAAWPSALALVLAKQRRIDEALTHARRGVELDPDAAERHFALALVLSETEALTDAIAEMEQAFALDPKLRKRHAAVLQRIKVAEEAMHSR